MGYVGFFFYMIVVGTFIPLPTQLILLPAGFLASQGKIVVLIVISSFVYKELKSYWKVRGGYNT